MGSRVFTSSGYVVVGKKAYQAVPPEGAAAVLRAFVTGSHVTNSDVTVEEARVSAQAVAFTLASRVAALEASVGAQRAFAFTSASVLLVYDAHPHARPSPSVTQSAAQSAAQSVAQSAEVRLIDLAHVRCGGEVDESSCFGLGRLSNLLADVHADLGAASRRA